jgi:hypothetical protein
MAGLGPRGWPWRDRPPARFPASFSVECLGSPGHDVARGAPDVDPDASPPGPSGVEAAARPDDHSPWGLFRIAGPDDPERRVAWLKGTLALAFAADLLVARRLWLSARAYPLVPAWNGLPPIPPPWDAVCLTVLLGLLGAVLLARQARPYLIAFVAFVTVYSLWDPARWTPPVYQYTFMLGALGAAAGRRADSDTGDAVLNPCRIIVAATYFWAGVQKVNVTFIREAFPWMLQPLVGTLSAKFRGWPFPLGLGAALMEAGIGIGLLLAPTRPLAVVAAVTMHALILVSIGPLGHAWDPHVWPWNVATAVIVWLLFWRSDPGGARQILWARPRWFQGLVIALFVVMPALSFFGLWDSYLSAELYSGGTRYGLIEMTDAAKAALPAEIRRYVGRRRSGRNVLDLTAWALAERAVETYPEARVFEATARTLCRYAPHPADMTLVIYGKAQWRTGRRTTTRHTCAELDGSAR